MSTPETATQSSATPTFTLFPKLPSELRLHIWELALQPRVIKVIAVRRDNGYQISELEAACKAIDATPPALLQTNYESHVWGQRPYILAFNDLLRKPICFDFQRDTLRIQRWMSWVIRPEDILKLRHLEIMACKGFLSGNFVGKRLSFMFFDKFCYLKPSFFLHTQRTVFIQIWLITSKMSWRWSGLRSGRNDIQTSGHYRNVKSNGGTSGDRWGNVVIWGHTVMSGRINVVSGPNRTYPNFSFERTRI
jgi:hypothetical protein